jgi:hypothetical protein
MRLKLLVAALTMTITVVAPDAADAALPLTQSRPYQIVCESHGGTFSVAVDFRSLYCDKEGGLFTAFTPKQLAVQGNLCRRLYGAFFGVQGFIKPDGTTGTSTFCSIA